MKIGGRRPEEARVFDSDAGFHRFHTQEGSEYGSFEVFWDDSDNSYGHDRNYDSKGEPVKPGWYWWSCFPGCLPEGEAKGPFGSSTAAMRDADEFHPDYLEEGE